MLAESLSSSLAGWLLLVAGGLAGAMALPLLGVLARRALPRDRRAPIEIEPIRFGRSLRVRRTPRHAIRSHRSLLAAGLFVIPAMLVLPWAAALRDLGIAGLQQGIALAVPTLLVMLHGRRRRGWRRHGWRRRGG